jgi:amidophosphoribosyltransferase
MCGVIGGVSSHEDIAPELYAGMWSLQHRGQESAGMITDGKGGCHAIKGMGTVETVFGGSALSELAGRGGIGHVRYSTTGESSPENIQPVEGVFKGIPFWLAHNGNLVRYEGMRNDLQEAGYRFKTTTDTEVIAALVARSPMPSFEEALADALSQVHGTYALIALYAGRVIGVRDPIENRPLVIGAGRGITLLASESAACDVLRLKTLREVEGGEMVVLDPVLHNWYSHRRPHAERRQCIFEPVYFFRPDSMVFFRPGSSVPGQRAQSVREQMGRSLWRESPVSADMVVPVPDSGNFAASGLAKESGLPFEMAIFRSHYIGRTFIKPIGPERARSLSMKFNIIPEIVQGRKVVLVDDSIVRANVMRKVVGLLRSAGTREIHVRISSPPYRNPCFYGIDTYRVTDELVARRCGGDVELIRREIGADSLAFLSLEELKKAAGGGVEDGFCDACFSGNYPIPVK